MLTWNSLLSEQHSMLSFSACHMVCHVALVKSLQIVTYDGDVMSQDMPLSDGALDILSL